MARAARPASSSARRRSCSVNGTRSLRYQGQAEHADAVTMEDHRRVDQAVGREGPEGEPRPGQAGLRRGVASEHRDERRLSGAQDLEDDGAVARPRGLAHLGRWRVRHFRVDGMHGGNLDALSVLRPEPDAAAVGEQIAQSSRDHVEDALGLVARSREGSRRVDEDLEARLGGLLVLDDAEERPPPLGLLGDEGLLLRQRRPKLLRGGLQLALAEMSFRDVHVDAQHPERGSRPIAIDGAAHRQDPPPVAGSGSESELLVETLGPALEVRAQRGLCGPAVVRVDAIEPAVVRLVEVRGVIAEHPGVVGVHPDRARSGHRGRRCRSRRRPGRAPAARRGPAGRRRACQPGTGEAPACRAPPSPSG